MESCLLSEACSHTSVDEGVQMRVLICFFWVVHLFFNMFIFTLSFGNDQGSGSFAGVVSVLPWHEGEVRLVVLCSFDASGLILENLICVLDESPLSLIFSKSVFCRL